MLELTQEEVSTTISRATEIASSTALSVAYETSSHGGLEAYVKAAEELGIPRDAMLQALRERHLLPNEDLKVGDRVFAKSADGAYYPAQITGLNGDSTSVVRFNTGGEQRISSTDLRPLTMVPGMQLQFLNDDLGMWCTGKLLEFDSAKNIARLTYVGEHYEAPITRVRLSAGSSRLKKQTQPVSVRKLLIRTAVTAASIGTGVGIILGYLLHVH